MGESKPKFTAIRNIAAAKNSASRSSAAQSSVSTQRSDQIRQRRAEKTRQPASGSASSRDGLLQRKKGRSSLLNRPGATQRSATRNGPPAPPPVMARSAVSGALSSNARDRAQSKRVQRARRTYNIAVGSQGAEMRLPAIPHIRIGWRLASFLVAGLLIFGLYQLWNAPLYRASEDAVKIHGLQRVSDSAVLTVLAAENKPVFSLDVQSMQDNLMAVFPEFSSAVVTVELPNTIVVSVTERVPVLIWHQDGRTNLIDTDGMLFPLRDETVQTNYPVVESTSSPPAPISLASSDEQSPESGSLISQGTGEKPGNILNFNSSAVALSGIALERARPFMFPEMVSAILSLASKAPEGAVITYDSLHGLGWKDRRGWDVYFGDILNTGHGDIEMKLKVYKSILEYLKSQDTKPAFISVEYVHAPYYRLAGESGD